MKSLPHQVLFDWAMSDDLELIDWVIDKQTNEPVCIKRGLTIAERLAALKAAAPFFAPTLKSIEARATMDIDSMDLDQAKATLMKIMADAINRERKAH